MVAGTSSSACKRMAGRTAHCLELFNIPHAAMELPEEERKKVVAGLVKSAPGGFAKDSLTGKASISFLEEIAVMAITAVWCGGIFGLVYWSFIVAAFGSWSMVGYTCVAWAVLCHHPLPTSEAWVHYMCRAKVNGWMYKYFSYRIMWTDDAMEEARACPAWLGAAGPHGVVPFANVLSVPAINTVVGRKFVGGTATSVHNTPFLRFMCMYGMTDVKPDNLARQLESGTCVGIVPDGIAGIFKCSREKEVFFIKERKGVAKFCLRTGHPVIPAYSVGNTEAFTAIFDRFGAMEWLSRKLQAAIFFFWGRMFLNIPRRTNITLLFGRPIRVEKMEEKDITPADVDRVHKQLLDAMQDLFDSHKEALGWGHKQMSFEA